MFGFDRMLMLATSHYFAVKRSKLVNSKRELCLKVLKEEMPKGPSKQFVSINLNNILHWVPDSQLEEHLRFCLRRARSGTPSYPKRKTPDRGSGALRKVVTDFEVNYDKWV